MYVHTLIYNNMSTYETWKDEVKNILSNFGLLWKVLKIIVNLFTINGKLYRYVGIW